MQLSKELSIQMRHFHLEILLICLKGFFQISNKVVKIPNPTLNFHGFVISHILCGGTPGTNILHIPPPSSAGAAVWDERISG